MKTSGILHDDSQAAYLLKITCDTLLLLENDGTCVDMIVKTEDNPYINKKRSLLGNNIFDHFPEETLIELRPAIEHVIRTGEISNANYDLPSAEKMYYFKCIIQKFDEDHILCQYRVLCQYRDITQRSQMKLRLQKAIEQSKETEKAAKIGYWVYNTATDIIHYSGYICVLAGEDEEVEMALSDYLEYVYPDDREILRQKLKDHPSPSEVLDYRVVKKKLYFLQMKIVKTYQTDNGTIVEGYTQNIDDIISRWNELEMITQAINNSNDSVFATDMEGNMIFANSLCRERSHIDEQEDITKYKAYEILTFLEDKKGWDEFVVALRASHNFLKFVSNFPYPDLDVISSDCTSYVIRNRYNQEVIWNFRRDISEQVRYERALRKAKRKAEESDRLKSAFLSNMSHEIRTPLNAIVGFSALMTDIDNPEERKKYYNIIESNNNRLLALINEVLDLSKIESGIVDFLYEPVFLSDLCQEIYDTQRIHAAKAELIFERPAKNICVKTDKNRLIQVLSNLINNAIKFTPKGTITFGYRKKTSSIEFYVKDTGIGIAKDQLNKIFERFVKVDNFAPGTGLGLAICKSIIERMGGNISVTSTKCVGSEFSFRIPAKMITIR